MSLIERTPDSVWMSPDRSLFACYFGCTLERLPRMRVGSRFGVVNSPNPFVEVTSPLYDWHYTVFEIAMYVFRRGLAPERSHRQIRRRLLTAEEIRHFEALRQWFESRERTTA